MSEILFDGYRFDPSDGRLLFSADGSETILRPQLARLLVHLLAHPGEVVAREQLFLAVWGEGAVVDFESGLAALVKELRQALDQCGKQAALLETVPRRGYRLNVELQQAVTTPPARRRPTAGIISLLLATLSVLLALAWWAWQGQTDPLPDNQDSQLALALLPLDEFGTDGSQPEHVGIILSDTLLARLWQQELDGLVLIGRTSTRPYQGRDDAGLALAEDLGVQLLIEGSVRVEAMQWQIELRLLATPQGQVIWSHSLSYADTQTLDVADASRQLVENLATSWPQLRAERHALR